MLATKPILDVCVEKDSCSLDEIQEISEQVRNSAQVIIKAKRATYYGIGMALTRITKAILGDENSVLTVSSYVDDLYGIKDVYLGLPTFVNNGGARGILPLGLQPEELTQLKNSADTLREFCNKLSL